MFGFFANALVRAVFIYVFYCGFSALSYMVLN